MNRMTDRQVQKHYLPATSFAGRKMITVTEIEVPVADMRWRPLLQNKTSWFLTRVNIVLASFLFR